VVREETGWKIVAGQHGTVPLFQMPTRDVHKGVLTFRAKLKSANLPKNAYLRLDLMMGNELVVCPVSRPISGVSDWASFESSYAMDENHIPDAARLNLAFDSRGTVWLKDVELVYVPAEPAQDLERLQGAWLITSFETGGRAVQGAKGDTLTIDTDKFLLAPKTELMKGTL